MRETKEALVLSLGWEDPLEEETATHSSILARRIPRDRSLASSAILSQRLDTTEVTSLYLHREFSLQNPTDR